MGSGTQLDPWTMAEAMNSPLINPGDTVVLLEGTYSGDVTCNLAGNSSYPVTIQAETGKRVTIIGTFTFSGNYVHLKGVEVGWTGADRATIPQAADRVKIAGTGNKVINCVIHDGDAGVSGGNASADCEIYGNLIFYNGDGESNLGHGMYVNHNPTNSRFYIRNNFVFNNSGLGIQIYGSQSINNFTVENNTAFENGEIVGTPQRNILVGGTNGAINPIVRYNRVWHSTNQEGLGVGYGTGNTVTGADVENNFCVGTFRLVGAVSPTVLNNIVYGSAEQFNTASYPTNTWDTYANRVDAVFLEANTYDANRAHLTIFNATEANAVDVDVSAVFGASGTVKAYNVQDYFTDIQTLTISSGVITVNMQATNRSVATPVGWTAPAKVFPQFGSFVLVKTA
jgi:hypothetical protein